VFELGHSNYCLSFDELELPKLPNTNSQCCN